MSRPLKLSVLLALALGSTQISAQSLGAIQVKSNLDQPLLAEVPLLSQAAGDTRNVQVSLASPEAYARAGVDRNIVPAGLQFAVAKNAQGQMVIRITSSAPVSEPYIDLLLEVKGGNGSVVREVTVLLDPAGSPAPAPVAPAAPAAPAAAPRQQAAPSAPAPERPAAQASERPTAAPKRAWASSDGKYGPVQKGQTLSSIAKQVSGNGGDLNQALIALQKANPEAFYRDNINALKAGAVLRVPTADEVTSQSATQALTQVRQQNEDWRGGAARKPTVVADAAAGNAPSAPAGKPSAEDRLALVPAKGAGQAASGKVAAAMDSLHQDLARSQETLTALRQQGEELKSRVDDLEGINKNNQRLLSLKDAEIAELQRKLADARKAANLPPAPAASAPAPIVAASVTAPAAAVSVAKAASAPAPSVATTATVPAPTQSAAVVAAAPVVDAKPIAPKPKPAAKPFTPQPEPEQPWYMQPWAWAVAAGAVVVLLLLALLGRRRKAPVVAATAAPSSLADRFGDAPLYDDHNDEDDADQRELLDELSEHPDDVGLHLELVSLYYERRDVEHFEAAAEAMYAHVADADQAEWQEVVHMGEDLTPQHPLFSHTPLPPQSDDEHAALEAFDIGRYADEPLHEDELPPVPVVPQKLSEYHFNFDLSPRPSATGDRLADAGHQAGLPVDDVPEHDIGHDIGADLVEDDSIGHGDPTHEPVVAHEPELLADESTWKFDDTSTIGPVSVYDTEADNFSDDPVDTKLDLARAYLDMGDADGARAMLDEVVAEGTQMQKDTATRMLADLH